MNIAPSVHLTYCTNIHPGETWSETYSTLSANLPAIKSKISPRAPMGVGLRLSAAAAQELDAPDKLADFSNFLNAHNLYVFTLNGFPYGAFHGTKIKDRVYLPDWSDETRLTYTDRLANILAYLLPDRLTGSISTVPGAYLSHMHDNSVKQIADGLIRHAAHLHELHRRTGKRISLALEPEPDCLLESSDDAVNFFRHFLYSAEAVAHFSALTGLPHAQSLQALKTHLGICLDICHLAILFESPTEAIRKLRTTGIPIHKVQLSAALRVSPPNAAAKTALRPFAEDIYLHQTAGIGPHGIRRWADLPLALTDETPCDEWRIHFHVPLWAERIGTFSTTRDAVAEVLALQKTHMLSAHLEVETYTWNALGAEHRKFDLTSSVSEEIAWVIKTLC
ncbi:MAG: metabolite traffic protein EboE [Pseudomonadota bacterium]